MTENAGGRLTILATHTARAHDHYTTARRRLYDALPGFPATTPGSGNVGGGTGGTASITERLAFSPDGANEIHDLTLLLELPALILDQTARVARGATFPIGSRPPLQPKTYLRHLTWATWILNDLATTGHEPTDTALRDLEHLVAHLTRILDQWGTEPTTPERDTAPLAHDPTGELCRSCLRVGAREPRYRGDLCRWCYDFNAAEGFHPPEPILEHRRDGKKITENMILPYRKAHRDARKKKRT